MQQLSGLSRFSRASVLTNFVILLSMVCFKHPTASMSSDYFDFHCFSDPVEDKWSVEPQRDRQLTEGEKRV